MDTRSQDTSRFGRHPLPVVVPAEIVAARPITRRDIMSAEDVAGLLGTSKSTIEDSARRGVIPSRKRGTRPPSAGRSGAVREPRDGDQVERGQERDLQPRSTSCANSASISYRRT